MIFYAAMAAFWIWGAVVGSLFSAFGVAGTAENYGIAWGITLAAVVAACLVRGFVEGWRSGR